MSQDLAIERVTAADAEVAAALWPPGHGLSLADRLFQALGRRLAIAVRAADRTWGHRRESG